MVLVLKIHAEENYQTIPWFNFDLSSIRSEIQSEITKINLKNTYLKVYSNFPAANELIELEAASPIS